jgi:hypothetical protein
MIIICGSGKILAYSKRKHGIENHIKEILEFCENKDLLYKREAELVNELVLTDPLNMNLKLGGEGGFEYINKIGANVSDLQKSLASYHLKQQWTDEKFIENQKIISSARMRSHHKNGIIKYDTFCGKTHSVEAKQKIGLANSIKQSGEGNSQFGTCWIYSNEFQHCKKIKKDDLEMFLEQGWIKGRKKF